jgi:hypothetical protein
MQTTANRTVPERVWHGLAILVAALIAQIVSFNSVPESIHDKIINRYIQQLRAGNGLVFNPGQPVLLIPSPLYMILRSVIENYGLFILATAIGAFCLFRIARRVGLFPYRAAGAVVLYALSWPSMIGFNSAFPLAGALCLLALDLGLSERWSLAGLTTALATFCRPEALIFALPLLILAVNRNVGRRYGLGLFIPLVAAIVILRLYYGPSLLDGLLGLKPESSEGIQVGVLIATTLMLIGLAAWGWYERQTEPIVALCGVWIAVFLFVVVILIRTSAVAPYGLIAGPLALLVGVGSRNFRQRFLVALVISGLVGGVTALINVTTIIDYFGPSMNDLKNYKCFASSTPSSILWSRTSPEQVLISLDGQLQPDLRLMVERGDIHSMLVRYAPEIYASERLKNGSQSRFDLRSYDSVILGECHAEFNKFVDRQVKAIYGTDIQLVRMALDQTSLTPGQLVRVRLDWKFARPPSKPVTIDVWVVDGDYVHARTTDEFAARVFENEWSTYHTLTLAKDAWPGPVTVMVGVIVSDGVIARVPVATLNVVPPE